LDDAALAAYVDAAAAAIGLTIRDEHLDGVVAAMQGLMPQIRLVLDCPLPEDLDSAPVFTP